MLKFVFGRSGYGKTEYVFNIIKSLALNGEENILLITPEQYSLIAERRLLTELGEKNIFRVDNGSFSRINDTVNRLYGCEKLPVLTKGGKAIIMMQAIEKSVENLSLFNKKLDTLSFVNSMLNIYDEMKSCNLSGEEVERLSKEIDNELLFRKLCDISLIMKNYEAIINGKFLDPSEEINRLYDKIKDKNYFKGKKVFIDGFNGFVAQEYKLLELVISEADEVTITLCTDYLDDENSLFQYVNKSAQILEKIALKAGIEVQKSFLKTNYRAKSNELIEIEKQLLSSSKKEQIKSDNYVSIYCAKSIADECSNTAREIKKLLRAGCKASDITVITRDLNKYKDELSYSFKKYDVPYFHDERQPIDSQPLVVMIKYLLRCAIFSFRTDDILSLVKTGLTDISDEEINTLENYVYLWSIDGTKWTKPFENSPRGFAGEISDADKNILAALNDSRQRLTAPVLYLKKQSKSKSSRDICEAIYNILHIYKADERLKKIAIDLSSSGHKALSLEQGRIWDMIMEILNQLAITVQGEITLKDFYKLFEMITSAEDLGVLPSGLDNVSIGQADRIRTDNPKYVFVLGANEGEFPMEVTGGGLLSENERRIMLDFDFKLYSYSEILNVQERYFAYMACSAPSNKLFVSYISGSSTDSAPSEIITDITSIITDIEILDYSKIPPLDLIETRENAFELMSDTYFVNDTFTSSLKEYFKNDSRYQTIRAIAENDSYIVKDKNISTSLFDKNMYISASRLEDYYNCPFRYFCKFGLNARPREKAEINPMSRGTLIHYVLEMILSDIGTAKLSQLNEEQIKSLVDDYILTYLKNEMGDIKDMSNRFEYNFKRLSKLIYGVVIHLSKEFSQCSFEAKAFELSIDKDGDVKPEIIALENGGTIQIRGSIDRVDTFTDNGETYVRVVDYKSGAKKFHLCDILAGLNLQMFVYLFSLCSDKNASLTGTPAGVLYMHASREVYPFDNKNLAYTGVNDKENSSFKMDGIVLEDSDTKIAIAMENKLESKYIPVKIKADGSLSGQLASLEELGLLHNKINELIAKMGNDLHNGVIKQSPVKNSYHKTTCDYCDYSDICSHKRVIEYNTAPEMADNDVKELLRKENSDNAEMDD